MTPPVERSPKYAATLLRVLIYSQLLWVLLLAISGRLYSCLELEIEFQLPRGAERAFVFVEPLVLLYLPLVVLGAILWAQQSRARSLSMIAVEAGLAYAHWIAILPAIM